jgi:hypothetical protein
VGVAKTQVVASGVEVEVEGADADAEDVRSLTLEERDAFLDRVRDHRDESNKAACMAVGIRRRDVRALMQADKEFLEDYRTARGYGAEQIFGQMVKLAIEGVEEPIASGGAIVGTKRVYSDRLLQTMFNGLTEEGKAMLAGKLGIDVNGSFDVNVKVQAGVDLGQVADALREAGVDLSQLGNGAAAELEAAEIVDIVDEPL